jgi:hypothetical protein
VPELPQWKTNFNTYDGIIQKHLNDGPIVRDTDPSPVDPDLFGHIRIREKSYGSSQYTVYWTLSCSKIRRI